MLSTDYKDVWLYIFLYIIYVCYKQNKSSKLIYRICFLKQKRMSLKSKDENKMTLDVAAWMFNIVTSVGIIIVNKALLASYGFTFGMSTMAISLIHLHRLPYFKLSLLIYLCSIRSLFTVALPLLYR